jgi:MFS family permease
LSNECAQPNYAVTPVGNPLPDALLLPLLLLPLLLYLDCLQPSISPPAVGYISRPAGAVLFGHLGDTRGRGTCLLISVLVMGIPTVLIGCLPSYHHIGLAAPILLAILRLIQGLAMGGEFGAVSAVGLLLYSKLCVRASLQLWFAVHTHRWNDLRRAVGAVTPEVISAVL